MPDQPLPMDPGARETIDPPPAPADRETIDPPATDPAATVDPQPLPVDGRAPTTPTSFGRFVIRDFLGEGVFGAVYRAYDPQLDREVALKVAKAAALAPERIERFRREARASAGLRHPNIVPLFEAGEADG